MTTRKLTVTGIQRRGYRPFQRSIGDAINEKALSHAFTAFVRDDLEALRRDRKVRNA